MKESALDMKVEEISAYLAENRERVIAECYAYMLAYDKACRLLKFLEVVK